MPRSKNIKQAAIERFFEPCVLYLLTLHSSYGYELRQNLEEKCHCSVDSGNLYRALKKLNVQGHIRHIQQKSPKGPVRNRYSITPKGRVYLKKWIHDLTEQQKVIEKLVSHYRQTPLK